MPLKIVFLRPQKLVSTKTLLLKALLPPSRSKPPKKPQSICTGEVLIVSVFMKMRPALGSPVNPVVTPLPLPGNVLVTCSSLPRGRQGMQFAFGILQSRFEGYFPAEISGPTLCDIVILSLRSPPQQDTLSLSQLK